MVRNPKFCIFNIDTESNTEVLREDVSLAEVQELVRRGEVDVKETEFRREQHSSQSLHF